MYNKIVRTPQLQSDPVIIKASNEPEEELEPTVEETPDEESEEESIKEKSGGGGSNAGVNEEALNTMLACAMSVEMA